MAQTAPGILRTNQSGGWRAYYVGPKLATLFDGLPLSRALRRMGDRGGDELHDLTVRNTPIDTGNLRSSWFRTPARIEHNWIGGFQRAYITRVQTEVTYAPYVNYGTGIYGPEHKEYEILPHPPNEFLSWVDPRTGRPVFARRVMHRGSPGQFMVESAAARLEATVGTVLTPEMERWKGEQEALAVEAMRGVVLP